MSYLPSLKHLPHVWHLRCSHGLGNKRKRERKTQETHTENRFEDDSIQYKCPLQLLSI